MASISVLALTGCPEKDDPSTERCQTTGLFEGSLGLKVDFMGRVDGEGGTASGGATLYSAPAATLIVPISMREQFEVTPTLLTFTPENWNVPQQLTVRAKAGVKTSDLTEGSSTSLLLGPTESELPELRCQTGIWGEVPLPRCGDGVLDSVRGEKCEPPNPRLVCPLGQASCQICNKECQFVAGVPNVCGDGMVTADEECDGRATRTCQQLGFDFGTAKCGASSCRHDTTDCVKVGCDGGACDPKFPAPAPVDDAFCLLGADSRARCFGSSTVGHHRPPTGPLSQLAEGIAHACGVAPGGQGQCWGRNLSQEATPAAGPFSKIVVGHYHSCGLTTAGAVSCWGSNDYRLSQVPSGGPFTDLASGDNHVCALTASGEAKCWGRRAEAQAFPPSEVLFTRIAAAGNHGCGLTAMGDIKCWGNFGPGKEPLKMLAAWPFVDLVVLRQDVCGLTADARIVCSAMNTGDLALPAGFVPVSLGDASSGLCALNAEGAAHCWGSPYAHEPLVGRFSRVDTGQQFCGQRIDGGITCGSASVTSDVPLTQFFMPNNNTSCGVTVDGTAICTMQWTEGGTSRTAAAPPVPFSRVAVFDDVACGLRTNGTVVCWGDVPNGGTGVPQDVMTDFAHNGSTGCGILTSGALSCWGIDPFGIRTPPSGTFTQVRMNRLYACALRTDGSIACWGTEVEPPPGGTGFTAIAMSEYQRVCALRAGTGLLCWGKRQQTLVPPENFGSLSSGQESASGRTLDGGLRHFDVAAFENGSVALVEARIDALSVGGRSFCMRSGEGVMCLSPGARGVTHLRETVGGPVVTDEGQCWLLDGGLPRCNFGATPPQEPLKAFSLGGRVLRGIAVDGGHLIQSNGNRVTGPFIAVESTPLSWCVQAPSGGWACEGVPDAGVRTSPTEPFERLTIARSEDLACGLYSDGGTRCWGKGLTRPMASVPAGPWVDIRLGRSHGCGLKPDGSVQCWGESQVGVLNAPTAQFSQIGSGNDYSCGIRSADRQLMCWGAYGVNWSQ